MPIQRVKDMPLSQIPNFYSWIITCWKQVSSVWMEVYFVDLITMGIIVLNQSLASDIPNFDGSIRTSTGDTSTIRMESHRVYLLIVINKLIYLLSRSEIPNLYCSVIRTSGKKSCIRREFARSDLIIVRLNWKYMLVIICIMHHQALSRWTGKQELTVKRKINWSHRVLMSLYNLWVTFNSVVPESNRMILRWGSNHISWRSDFNIINWAFMTNESERSHGRFEVPNHNCSVLRSRHNLLQVWVECNSTNFVFVTFEWSL